jgi:hypothetical protein
MRSSDDIIGFELPADVAADLAKGGPDCAGPLVESTLVSLLELIREQLKLDVMFVSEFADGRRVFRHVATAPDKAIIRPGDSHAMEDSICVQVIDGRVPKMVRDLRVLRTRQSLPDVTRPIGAHISVPVRMPDGSIFGTLCGFAIERSVDLSERDLRRMEVAAQATARLLAQAAGHTDWAGLRSP